MKKIRTRYLLIAALLIYGTACKKNTDAVPNEKEKDKVNANLDYEQEMRTFIQDISTFARQQKPGFMIVPQDGLSLLTSNGQPNGTVNTAFLQAIDAVAQEEVFYGYMNNDNVPTPTTESNAYVAMCKVATQNGKPALVTDYCTGSNATSSYAKNFAQGFISFAAKRNLDNIPTSTPYNVHTGNVTTLAQAKNFLYLIDPGPYDAGGKTAFINKLKATNYDVLVLDGFFNDDTAPLDSNDIKALKVKANGGTRLVLAYVAIGHAEDYRGYWDPNWLTNPPAWLDPTEDPDWEGNYMVRYWMPEWKAIVFGNNTSYIQQFLNAKFDGAYLDLYDYRRWQGD